MKKILFVGLLFVLSFYTSELMADDSCFPGVTGGSSMPYCCGDVGRKNTADQMWTKITGGKLYIKSENALLSTDGEFIPKDDWVKKCDALKGQSCEKLLSSTKSITARAVCQKNGKKYFNKSNDQQEDITDMYVCTAKECNNDNGVMYFNGSINGEKTVASNISSNGICYDRNKFQSLCAANCHGCPIEGQTCLPALVFSSGENKGKIIWTIPEYRADNAEEVYDTLTQQNQWKNIGWITAKCDCWDPAQGQHEQDSTKNPSKLMKNQKKKAKEQQPPESSVSQSSTETEETDQSCDKKFKDFEPEELREQRIKCCQSEILGKDKNYGLAFYYDVRWDESQNKCICNQQNFVLNEDSFMCWPNMHGGNLPAVDVFASLPPAQCEIDTNILKCDCVKEGTPKKITLNYDIPTLTDDSDDPIIKQLNQLLKGTSYLDLSSEQQLKCCNLLKQYYEINENEALQKQIQTLKAMYCVDCPPKEEKKDILLQLPCKWTADFTVKCTGNKTEKHFNIPIEDSTKVTQTDYDRIMKDKNNLKKYCETYLVPKVEELVKEKAKEFCKSNEFTEQTEIKNEKNQTIRTIRVITVIDEFVDTKQDDLSDARLKIKSFINSVDKNKTVWKTAEGKFNTARLASDLTAGVVLGTIGGVVSGVVIKKKQVEKGFDALHCTVGGQPIADWGDIFSVGLH